MPSHRQLQQLLAVYQELTTEQKTQVDAHLRHCGECQRTLAAYTAMDRTLQQRLQHNLQLVTAHAGLLAQPRFAALPITSSYRAAWLDDLLFRLLQPRPLALRLTAAMMLLLLVMALSTLFGGWLPFEQPVMASTPTQVADQSLQGAPLGQEVVITYTPTATPTAISLIMTMTPVAGQ